MNFEKKINPKSSSLREAFDAHHEMWANLNKQWSQIFSLQHEIDQAMAKMNESCLFLPHKGAELNASD